MRRRSNGEGSLYYNEKFKRFEGKLVYIDPLTQDKKRASFYSVKSGKEVVKMMKRFKDGLEQGVVHISDKLTLKEWLEYWLENYKKNEIRVKTYERYYGDINGHIIPYVGKFALQNLTTDLLQRHFIFLLSHGGKNKQGLSPRTVNATRRLLIEAIEDAVGFGYLARNCVKKTKPIRVKHTEFMVLSHDMAHRLIQVAKDYNYQSWIVVVIAIGTGMRLAEIFGLTWGCIDFEKRKLVVVQSAIKTRSVGTQIQSDLKTQSSRREIPLPGFVMDALVEYKQWQENVLSKMPSYKDQGYVVANNYGNLMHPATFSYHVFKNILLVRAGISSNFRFHDLRHTHATWLLEAGVNVKVVSERLGHANIRITLDTYAHVLKTMQGEAVKVLDKIHNETIGEIKVEPVAAEVVEQTRIEAGKSDISDATVIEEVDEKTTRHK